MAKKPCRFCMRVRELLTKCLRSRKSSKVLRTSVRSALWDKVPHTFHEPLLTGSKFKKNKGYIQGDSLLTVIVIIGLVIALLIFLR